MPTKDVTDLMVCKAYEQYRIDWPNSPFPYEWLQEKTGECFKVCYRAMERACDRDLVEYGVSLRTGWLTDKGKKLLRDEWVKELLDLQLNKDKFLEVE